MPIQAIFGGGERNWEYIPPENKITIKNIFRFIEIFEIYDEDSKTKAAIKSYY